MSRSYIRFAATTAALILVLTLTLAAKKELPPGLLVASVGEQVVMADPLTGKTWSHQTGPVGWLYPAPGGVLFAPNLVDGATTVLDLRTAGILDKLDGVTMPVFGGSADRYLVVAQDVLMVSYPERAYIARVEAGLKNPWQTIVTEDNGILMVLERQPDGHGGCSLAAIDLHNRQVVYRRPLSGDIVHFALSYSLRLVALADRQGHRVTLVNPSTLVPAISFSLDGSPQDVGFAGKKGEKTLVIAVTTADGKGQLLLIELKQSKKELREKKRYLTLLPAAPTRLAVGPWLQRVAVALDSGQVVIAEIDKGTVLNTAVLPDEARDLVWSDPQARGPLLPEWSDRRQQQPQITIGFRPD
jgi:hypothetical protein